VSRRLLASFALLAFASVASAQETIFNVPSPDVLDKGKLYLETDQYIQNWKSGQDDVGFGLLRGVYGVGSNVEVGLNSGPFDYYHSSVAFVDATVKWRPIQADFGEGNYGLFLGNNFGVNVHGDSPHEQHDYAYAAGFVSLPETHTRLSAGPYYVTHDYFAPEERWGAQVTLEQPIASVQGLTAAADWFSGDGAAATVGLIWTKGPWAFYAGYGFANTGRDDDLLTFELGYTF
jgi:hypothetical protein